ncbi:hypothetical protein BH10PSE9_BH10PSE9_09610 [soil metagenome]
MRVLVAVLVLALAILPASAGYAVASVQSDDCAHHMAAADGGHDGHHQPAQKPAGDAVCCILHCVTLGGPALLASRDAPPSARVRPLAELPFEGTDIEPALPPPRG